MRRAGQVSRREHLAALEIGVAQLDGEELAQPAAASSVAPEEPLRHGVVVEGACQHLDQRLHVGRDDTAHDVAGAVELDAVAAAVDASSPSMRVMPGPPAPRPPLPPWYRRRLALTLPASRSTPTVS